MRKVIINPIGVELNLLVFYSLQALNFMCQGLFLADLVAVIGTQDLVFVKLIVSLFNFRSLFFVEFLYN